MLNKTKQATPTRYQPNKLFKFLSEQCKLYVWASLKWSVPSLKAWTRQFACRTSKPGTRRVEGEKEKILTWNAAFWEYPFAPKISFLSISPSLTPISSSSSSSSSSVGELISFPLLPYLGICTAARCFKNIFWRKSPYINFATILLPQNIKLFSFWSLLLTH